MQPAMGAKEARVPLAKVAESPVWGLQAAEHAGEIYCRGALGNSRAKAREKATAL